MTSLDLPTKVWQNQAVCCRGAPPDGGGVVDHAGPVGVTPQRPRIAHHQQA